MMEAKLQVQFENIPDELKEIPRWVMWNWPTKAPLNFRNGKSAKVNDSSTWGTFDQVVEAYHAGGYSGVGLVLTKDDNIVGPDFDNCLENGNPKDWAVEPLTMLNTYTEISPSGLGVRQIAYGAKPGNLCKAIIKDKDETMPKEEAIEFFEHGRFLTITGNIWPGAPRAVNHCQDGINALYAHMEGVQKEYREQKKKNPSTTPSTAPLMAYNGNGYNDIEKAENALQRLSPWRCDAYNAWLNVGFALCELGGAGLSMWDRWSSQSSKYTPGICEKKWGSMTPGTPGVDITLGSLFHWADEDDPRSAAVVVARIKEIAGSDVEDAFKVAASELGPIIGYMQRAEHPQVIESLVSDLGTTKTDANNFVRGCVADAKKERAAQAAIGRTAEAERVRADENTIDVTDKQLKEIYKEALGAMVRHVKRNPTEPSVYVRGGALARVATDENKNKTIAILDAGSLNIFLSSVAQWVRVTESERGVKVNHIMPHVRTVQSLLSIGNLPGIPGLDGIVTAPIFGPGGHLHTSKGYDAQTRLYFAKNGLEIGDTEPTPENITAAKKLIFENLLTDFPFKDDASKAHAVALLLVGFVRPMIDGPTPLHLIDSPTPGTGKGLLASACTMPAMGPNLPSTSAGRDDDEWRKRLTSALMAGGNVVNIDNVTDKLDSGVLASAITQPVWEDRVLGSSHNVRIKIRNIWIATGNNTALSQEISRRCIWIRLDSDTEKPWERDNFTHADLLSWAAKNRGELATAAITIIRDWVDNGQKPFSGRVKGSFSAWSSIIGGILENAEIPGFLANEAELYDETVSTGAGLSEFVKEWWQRYTDTPTKAGILFELASFPDDLRDADKDKWLGLLEDQLGGGNQASRLSKFGRLLTDNRDKVIAGYKIKKGKRTAGGYNYELEEIEPKGMATQLATEADLYGKPITIGDISL